MKRGPFNIIVSIPFVSCIQTRRGCINTTLWTKINEFVNLNINLNLPTITLPRDLTAHRAPPPPSWWAQLGLPDGALQSLSVTGVDIPAIWKNSVIIPILKARKPRDKGRLISLPCPAVKILERLLPHPLWRHWVLAPPAQLRTEALYRLALLPISAWVVSGFNQHKPPSRTIAIAWRGRTNSALLWWDGQMESNWQLLPRNPAWHCSLQTLTSSDSTLKCESLTRWPHWTEPLKSWVSRWTPTSNSVLTPANVSSELRELSTSWKL